MLRFHAGTKPGPEGDVLTAGGRVMALTAYGDSIPEAASKALAEAARVDFEGKTYRRDISKDLQ